jgi:hypothetical protein
VEESSRLREFLEISSPWAEKVAATEVGAFACNALGWSRVLKIEASLTSLFFDRQAIDATESRGPLYGTAALLPLFPPVRSKFKETLAIAQRSARD